MKNDTNSTITKNLIIKLRELFDDNDFINGILVYADNIEDRKAILDFINEGKDVDVETVTVLALELNDNRNE